MHKLNTFTLFFSVIGVVTSNQQDNGIVDRMDRLLLTDPDFAGTRLTNIEKTIQDITQSVSQLKGELVQEKQTVSQLQNELTQEKQTRAQSVSQLKGELAQEKQTVLQLQNELSQEKQTRAQEKVELDKVFRTFQGYGSTYVRWGRKQCPGVNTEMIYTGFMAGQTYKYNSQFFGGPSNTLCLPSDPQLSNITAPGNSYIYGTEFEDGSFFRKGAQNEDVPCAFCRSINTTTSVMIPGRNACYSGWKIEYRGILASNALWHKPSSYICVDSDPEYLQAGERDDDGNLLYATAAQCGSLPCPPYSNHMAVYCVVCSK